MSVLFVLSIPNFSAVTLRGGFKNQFMVVIDETVLQNARQFSKC